MVCVHVVAVYMNMCVWYVYIRGLAKTGNQGDLPFFFETPPPPLLFSSPLLVFALQKHDAYLYVSSTCIVWYFVSECVASGQSSPLLHIISG